MGDLNIEKPSRTGHARLRFAQGLVHEEYLLHLFEKVRPYCRAVPYFPKTLHNVTGKFYPSIRFNTCSFACFDEFFNLNNTGFIYHPQVVDKNFLFRIFLTKNIFLNIKKYFLKILNQK